MNVALNALCIDNKSGTGRYAYGLIDGFVQQKIADTTLHVFLPCNFKLPEEWKNSYNVRFFSVPSANSTHRIYWEQFSLPKLLKILKISIMHSPAFISPCFFQNDLHHIVSIHDLAFLKYPNTIPMLRKIYLQFMIRRSIKHAQTIITDSNAIADEIRQEYILKSPVHSIHLGVDDSRFSSLKQQNDHHILAHYQITIPYFLFVGTIEPRKNLETILNAYCFAKQKGLDKQLVIVGRYGWMVDENLLKQDDVIRLGHISESHLPALYRNADALVAPSLYEGFDLPTVEALACGTKALASDIPIHREILKEKAVYIQADHHDGWAKAMLNDHGKEKIPVFCRTWKDVAAETIEIYKSIG